MERIPPVATSNVHALIVVALVAGACVMHASFAETRDTALDTRAILRIEAGLCSAWQSGNADVLRKDLDRFFLLTDSRGVVTNRDENIEEVAIRDPVYQVFRNHEQKIRLYGDAAIVTGITTVQGHSASGKAFAGDYAYTDTWTYSEGRWKLASSHASRIEKP